MIKFINLTPHDIVLDDCVKQEVIPSSGNFRCFEQVVSTGSINGWNVNHCSYQIPSELPPMLPDTIYIVSNIVLQTIKAHRFQRDDFVAPDTGSTARRANGQVLSLRGFIKI